MRSFKDVTLENLKKKAKCLNCCGRIKEQPRFARNLKCKYRDVFGIYNDWTNFHIDPTPKMTMMIVTMLTWMFR